MKLQVISLNMGGWAWKTSQEDWETRLTRACEYLRTVDDVFLIALQGVQLSGGKYLNTIKQCLTEYEVVLPRAYRQQPKSCVSLILLNKKLVNSYRQIILEDLEENLRYVFIVVKVTNENETMRFWICNVDVPCFSYGIKSQYYQHMRECMRERFEDNIIEIAKQLKNENFILLGDWGISKQDELIQKLAYLPEAPMCEPIIKENMNGYEHIFYSKRMLFNRGIIINNTKRDPKIQDMMISNHAVLRGGIEV